MDKSFYFDVLSRADWELIRWIDAPQPDDFLADLHALGEALLLVS